MSTPHTAPATAQLPAALEEVDRATAALERARLEDLPLSELRRRYAAVGAALDAAVAVARAAGRAQRRQRERLRTQRELHLLAGLSTAGIRVPSCARSTSLSALGPLIPGMTSDPAPAFGPASTRGYGLELADHIDGGTAGQVLDRSGVVGVAPLPEQRPSPEHAVRVAS